MTLSSEKELQIVFGKEYKKRDTVEYVGESSFAVWLNDYHIDNHYDDNIYNYYHYHYRYYHDYYRIPVPSGLKDIAVNKTGGFDIFDRIYITYLWDMFYRIRGTYTERIQNGEDIEKLADEIVPVSRTDKKPATNVLRNICYDRAFNRELPYDEAWKKVRDTYRKFVIKVLGAVKWLSEHEDELKPNTTDDNNEEME